jgi:hypothetical protein
MELALRDINRLLLPLVIRCEIFSFVLLTIKGSTLKLSVLENTGGDGSGRACTRVVH